MNSDQHPALTATDQALLTKCSERNFTPGTKQVAALVELWKISQSGPGKSKPLAKRVISALSRGGRGVAEQLERGLWDTPGPERAMRLAALANMSSRGHVAGFSTLLLRALSDNTPRVVREAARIAGRFGDMALKTNCCGYV